MSEFLLGRPGPYNVARKHYWEMLHNSAVYAPVYGPADLLDGVPFYCDGRHLLIIGYSLDSSLTELAVRVARVINRMLDRWSDRLRSIEFWGPERPRMSDIPKRFTCTTIREPDAANCDVFLLLKELTHDRMKSRRDVRRAVRNGLWTRMNSAKEISDCHNMIVKRFFRTHPTLGRDERKYFALWRDILKDQDSAMFEVFDEGRLTGFTILNCFAERKATYAYGFFDNRVAGTSDLAHCAMIKFCRDAGLDELDLGYSIHRSLLRYKLKWGPTRCVSPPWSVCWSAPRAAPEQHHDGKKCSA